MLNQLPGAAAALGIGSGWPSWILPFLPNAHSLLTISSGSLENILTESSSTPRNVNLVTEPSVFSCANETANSLAIPEKQPTHFYNGAMDKIIIQIVYHCTRVHPALQCPL